MRSVNENALAVKGKVHCLAATLDRQGTSERTNKLYFAFPFIRPLSKDKNTIQKEFINLCKQQ